jgi:hypothetical protein
LKQNIDFQIQHLIQVKIPKGTKSVIGGELKEDFYFNFTTPTVKVENFLPSYYPTIKPIPLVYIQFDQKIDKKKVIKFINFQNTEIENNFTVITREEAKKFINEQDFKRFQYFNSYKQFIEPSKDKEKTIDERSIFLLLKDLNNPLKLGNSYYVTFKTGIPSEEVI